MKLKKLIKVLVILLILSILALIFETIFDSNHPNLSDETQVKDNYISKKFDRMSGQQAFYLFATPVYAASDTVSQFSIHKGNASENEKFYLPNMFPGDVETREYKIDISFSGTVTVNFSAEVLQKYEKLAEVLNLLVELDNEVLYDGTIKEMPSSVSRDITTFRETTRTLNYKITAYLDTKVGNEYMNKQLMASFKWWVDEDVPSQGGGGGGIIDNGKPGDDKPPVIVHPELNKEDHFAYIVGRPGGASEPDGTLLRSEVATIFFRLLTEESRNHFWAVTQPFYDVNRGQWHNIAISTLTNAGIINGFPGNVFKPDSPITRAEFLTMATRFTIPEDAKYEKDSFTDIKGHWANVYINYASETGIVFGYQDNTFRPEDNITRAEAIAIVNRILGRVAHKDLLHADMIRWKDNMDENKWYYLDIQEATNSHEYTMHTDSDGNKYEIWTKISEIPDWVNLEKDWEYHNSKNLNGKETVSKKSIGEGKIDIDFGNIAVNFDENATSSIYNQAQKDNIQFELKLVGASELNDAQKEAFSEKSIYGVVTAEIKSEDKISNFDGGLAKVTVPITQNINTSKSGYGVYYVSENGNIEAVKTEYTDGNVVFYAKHFSDYVIVREDGTINIDSGKLTYPSYIKIIATVGFLVLFISAAFCVISMLKRRRGRTT